MRGERRRARAAKFDHGEPIRYLSLAPLTGVMLVAVALISLSFPAKIHALTFDLYGDLFFGDYVDVAPTFRITVNAQDQIFWDGRPTSHRELASLLELVQQSTKPYLIFSPDGAASYGATVLTLDTIKASGIREFCVEGLEEHQKYESPANADLLAPTAPYCDPWGTRQPEGLVF